MRSVEEGRHLTDTDSALRDYPELFKEYFGTVIRRRTTSSPR